MNLRPFADDLLREADQTSYLAVDHHMWVWFVKLAFARDAYRGFQSLMARLDEESR